MEYIKGESLREPIRKKKLLPRRALELAIQIADGLSVAHRKGVVHRDLKPENILISDQGYAKVIDFGLAKLVEPLPGDSEAEQVETKDGLVRGTVSYMSPEQARGKPLDVHHAIVTLLRRRRHAQHLGIAEPMVSRDEDPGLRSPSRRHGTHEPV